MALELNKAVLHSYKMAGVTIVDHFTQADQVRPESLVSDLVSDSHYLDILSIFFLSI